MTEKNIKSNTAMLTNVALFNGLMDYLMNRDAKLPGIGVFCGFSGLGKTESAIYAANKYRAYYIRMGETWSRSKLIDSILKELGVQIKGTIATKMDKIIELLFMDNRPLIIDEADYAFSKGMHEIIREIHDETNTPIILIGEELLPTKIKQYERFDNRILDWVYAQVCSFEDARKLADLYVEDIEIADDLLELIVKQSKGVARRIVVNFSKVREEALNEGIVSFNSKTWGERKLYTGEAIRRAG